MPTTTTPLSPQEQTPPKTKKRRPILRAIAIIILLLISAAAIDIAYIATRPDIPPFDESALALERPKIPDNINGYVLLDKALGKSKFEKKNPIFNYYKNTVKNKRNPSASEIIALNDKYGKTIERIQKAAYSKEFQSTSHVRRSFNGLDTDLLSVIDYTKVNSTLAWGDLRNGNEKTAAQRLRANLKIANALISAKGNMECFTIGSGIEKRVIGEINAILDEGLLSPEITSEILGLLKDENRMLIENAKNTAKATYAGYKDLNRYTERTLFTPQGKKENPISSWWTNIGLKMCFREYTTNKMHFDFYKSIIENSGKPYSAMKIADINTLAHYFSKSKHLTIFQKKLGWIKITHSANSVGIILTAIALPNMKYGLVDNVIIRRTENELFRTKAAITLYKIKHGKLPENLAALTPEFLPSIPLDPFDGKPVRYNKSKNLIYSVGYNLKDNGGSAKTQALAEKANTTELKKEQDIILPLSPLNKTHP